MDDRKKMAALRKKAYDLNISAEKTLGNTKHYAVVNEKLVLFVDCKRDKDKDDRLVGGQKTDVAYSFVSDGDVMAVHLN